MSELASNPDDGAPNTRPLPPAVDQSAIDRMVLDA